jgi:hypothetical protein
MILVDLEQLLIDAADDDAVAVAANLTPPDVGHHSSNNVILTLQDRLCAIRYRIHVKKSLQTALDVANQVLDRRNDSHALRMNETVVQRHSCVHVL